MYMYTNNRRVIYSFENSKLFNRCNSAKGTISLKNVGVKIWKKSFFRISDKILK